MRVVSGSDPAAQLDALRELRRELDAVETELAAEGIRSGLSWREIGAAIGVSKQAAHRRHRESVARIVREAESPEHTEGSGVNVAPSARRAVRIARQEAARLGGSEVGTEHLLLGILQCGDERAVGVLRALGVSVEAARDALQPTAEMTLEAARRAYARSQGTGAATVLSPVARRVLERALTQAATREPGELTALDILRATVSHEESGAARTFARLAINPSRLRAEIAHALDPAPHQRV